MLVSFWQAALLGYAMVGLGCSNIVLVLFMIGIGQAWARGLVIDCGCFG